jgi:hypothetical protein
VPDAILVGGDYENGDMILEELNLQLKYRPGCLFVFRGRVFKHEVSKWTGAERNCLCLYTYRVTLEQVGTGDFNDLLSLIPLLEKNGLDTSRFEKRDL